MGRLMYGALMSLDGYVADERGNFNWAEPGQEVHEHVNDIQRPIGTHLLGRRMYEVLRVWETMDEAPDVPPYILEYAAIWKGADKIVYSRTLDEVTTARTRI